MPYGPEVSWPSGGMQRMEFDTGEYHRLVDDYQGPGDGGRGPANRAAHDYGYGDPGYADPRYDGPRYDGSRGPRYDGPRDRYQTGPMPAVPVDHAYPMSASPAAYGYPPVDGSYRAALAPVERGYPATATGPMYPVTGMQEVLTDDYTPPGKADPRLSGLRYDDLRYDEPRYADEAMSDEAWYAEIRRGEPISFAPSPVAPSPIAPVPAAPQAPARRPGYPPLTPAGGFRPADAAPRMGAAPAAARSQTSYLAAPVAQAGVLTPPTGQRIQTAPATAYRQQDEYTALLRDLEVAPAIRTRQAPASQPRPVPAKRAGGRRRGRSSDHRLWLGLIGIVVVAAGSIYGIRTFMTRSSGPAHTLAKPQVIGNFPVNRKLGTDLHAAELCKEFGAMGQTSAAVCAAYGSRNTVAGVPAQNLLVIAAAVPHQDAAGSMRAFMKHFPGSAQVPAGPLGGEAACTKVTPQGTAGAMTMCVWFDNDTLGVFLSSSMQPMTLATDLPGYRAAVEQVAAGAK